MYIVTKAGTYQGKRLSPGDELEVTTICPTVVQRLIRQGLVRDVHPDEARTIKLAYEVEQRERQRRAARAIIAKRRAEYERLEAELERMTKRQDEIAKRHEQLRESIDHLLPTANDEPEKTLTVQKEVKPAPTVPRIEADGSLKERFYAMSSKQLQAYAKESLGMTGDLPKTKVKLIPLMLEAAAG